MKWFSDVFFDASLNLFSKGPGSTNGRGTESRGSAPHPDPLPPGEGKRVGNVRVFYDVTASWVEVLAIVSKEGAQRWPGEAASRE